MYIDNRDFFFNYGFFDEFEIDSILSEIYRIVTSRHI